MKRNMDLIRDLLLYVEDLPAGQVTQEVDYDVERYEFNDVLGHLKLLIDSDFIDGQVEIYHDSSSLVILRGLTMPGYDFIDSIRNESVWNQTKEKVASVGGSVAMEIIKDIAIFYGRQLLKLD
jgi:Hypothetical protein (DUF2513)